MKDKADLGLKTFSWIQCIGILLASLSFSISRTAFSMCSDSLLPKKTQVEQLVERHLSNMEDLFAQLVRIHPIATSEYVFVGRSPALLSGLSDAQKEMFPNLRSWVLPISLTHEPQISRAELNQRFLDLFNQYRDLPAGRNLVFVDFILEGRTFTSLDRLLVDSNLEGSYVGFSHGPIPKKLDRLAHPFHQIQISMEVENSVGELKVLAPYAKHSIGSSDYAPTDSDPQSPSKAYQQTVSKIKADLFL